MPIGSQRISSFGVPGPDIPDSVLYQLSIDNISVSDGTSGFTWPESEQGDDMAVTGATYQEDLFGSGHHGVSSDGAGDYGQTSTMGSFGSQLDGNWALAIGFSTTDTGDFLGQYGSNSDTGFMVTNRLTDNGEIRITYGERGSDNPNIETSEPVDDGGDYVYIFNKEGAEDHGVEIYDAADSTDTVVNREGSLGSINDFSRDMTYFARNFEGTVENHIEADWSHIHWFNDSLDQSERQAVFDLYDWWS